MQCPSCGKEVPEGTKFCTNCGSPIDEQTTVMPPVPPAGAQAPGAGPGRPPGPPAPTQQFAQTAAQPPPHAAGPVSAAPGVEKGKRNTPLIILIVLLALLVIGGAVAGIIIWRMGASNRPVAEVKSVGLTLADGGELDPDEVPLDKELSLGVRFIARYKEGGEGTLKVSVTDNEGNKVAGKTWKVESNDRQQSETLKYSMTQGTGKPLEARAELEVVSGDKTAKGTGSLTYKAVAGKGKNLKLKEAKARALAKLNEATEAVNGLLALGIDANDLTLTLDKAYKDLDAATTEEQANAIYDTAVSIINECNARKAAYNKQKTREQDVAACQQVMMDYVRANTGELANLHLVSFTMNDAGTHAEATVVGTITAHWDPAHAGEEISARIVANKEGGTWVVVYFGSSEEQP